MALRVWLPLNGTIENKGLSDFTYSTSTIGGYEAGKIGKALSLLNSKLVFTVSSLTGATKFSLAFWYKPRTNSNLTGNWYNIIALSAKSADESVTAPWRCESSYGNSYHISHHNNQGNPIDGGHGSLVSAKNKWYHICLTCDGEASTKAYVDGVLKSTITYNGGHLTGAIGIADENAKPDGLLNDVRIYDHCLSPLEVKEISQGLVLHYKLDDITNGIQDSSGYNHNAISNGSTTPTISSETPCYSGCTSFTSGGRIMTIESSADILPTDMITVNIWFKSSNTANRFISCTEGGGWNFENNGGCVRFPTYIAGKGYTLCNSSTTWSSLNGAWHMITGTYDRSYSRIYIDGILDTETASTYPDFNIGYNSNTPLTLGAEAQTFASPLAGTYVGSLSDCRIYCTALSAEDIKRLYNTRMSIDNLGNFHVFELNENSTNSLTKSGILKDNIIEPFISLSDESKWQLLLFHYVDNGNNLFTSTNAAFCNDFGLYSRLQYIDNFIYDNKYEFYVIQDGATHRWTQTNAPMSTNSVAGLTVVSGSPGGGICKCNGNTLLAKTGTTSNWWDACGCYKIYNNGIPGFNGAVCKQYLALYARVSDFNAKIANLTAYSNNFIEQ